jgi:glycosyltransferase involved in cell wall biosynthesis
MKPHIGFVLEQALGHVAYGMSLRRSLRQRTDIECTWLEVPAELGGFRRLSAVGRNWTFRGSVRAWRSISEAHGSRPLDALMIHTPTISLFSGGHMRRIPTLLSLDATPANYDELAKSYGHRVHASPIEHAKRLAQRSVMRHAKWYTTWSQWAKESLEKDYGMDGRRVTILPPGTTISAFPDPRLRGARRPGPLRLLFVGGDFERKGGDLLLDVHRKHLQGACELHLVTGASVDMGEGVYVYNGLKPHSLQLLQLYADADVFVLPTRGDCLAVVLGEAMASGLPVITTRVGAHAEAVEEGRSGFVIEADDAAALRDRIERLARDPRLAARMGLRSREIAEERFDMDKNANRIADLLVDMARRPSSVAGA